MAGSTTMTKLTPSPDAILLAEAEGIMDDFLADADDVIAAGVGPGFEMKNGVSGSFWIAHIMERDLEVWSLQSPDPVTAMESAIDRYYEKKFPVVH